MLDYNIYFLPAGEDTYIALSDTLYTSFNGTQPNMNLCRILPDPGAATINLDVPCDVPTSGRYVYIYQPAIDDKSVHEIEVYGSLPSSKCNIF